MSPRFVLSPEAVEDLASIWNYIQQKSSAETADRVESVIRERVIFLARNPGAGHHRKDITDRPVRFFPVYSYLIVYCLDTKPLQVVAIIHGRRDIGTELQNRPS